MHSLKVPVVIKYGRYKQFHIVSNSFVMSVRPSDRTEQLGSDRMDCYYSVYVSIFGKSVYKIQVSIKCDQNSRYFTQAPQQPVLYTSTRTAGTLHKHHNSRYFTQAPKQPVLYTSTTTAGTLHKHQNSR